MLGVSKELEVGKYAKLALLATLVEPKSLSELGTFWFNENGRFYKEKAREEVSAAVDKGFLKKEKSKYKANTEEIISRVYSNIKDKKLKEILIKFWHHPFSQKTYLCCESIKNFFNNNPEKAAEAKLILLLNMPLMLHRLQEKDSEVYSLFVSMQGLEKYTNILNLKSEHNASSVFNNLNEKTDWLDNLNKIIKNKGYLLKQTGSDLTVKGIVIK
jgi:hypothetical protein